MKPRKQQRSACNQDEGGDVVIVGSDPWDVIFAEHDASRKTEAQLRAEGWRSTSDLLEKWKCHKTTALDWAEKLVAAGKLERTTGRIGPLRVPAFFFRPLKAGRRG